MKHFSYSRSQRQHAPSSAGLTSWKFAVWIALCCLQFDSFGIVGCHARPFRRQPSAHVKPTTTRLVKKEEYEYNFPADSRNFYQGHFLDKESAALVENAVVQATNSDDQSSIITQAIDQLVSMIQQDDGVDSNPKPIKLLLKRWWATLQQIPLGKTVWNMISAACFCIILGDLCGVQMDVENSSSKLSWLFTTMASKSISSAELAQCNWTGRLQVVQSLWQYQLLPLVTITLAFLFGQAYFTTPTKSALLGSNSDNDSSMSRKMPSLTRDISILLATHSHRRPQNYSGVYNIDEAGEFLTTMARQLQLYHVLVAAYSHTAATIGISTKNSRQFEYFPSVLLLTNRGLTKLAERGFLTQPELLSLLQQPALQERHNVILEWMVLRCHRARQMGILEPGVFPLLLDKLSELKATTDGTTRRIVEDGRRQVKMIRVVQLLVDFMLFLAPLALFSELGWLCVIYVALLTLFYQGLLNMTKGRLQSQQQPSVRVMADMIQESNSALVQWLHHDGAMGLSLPTSSTSVIDFVI